MAIHKLKLTRRALEWILDWGNFISKSPDYRWTKRDSEVYYIITQELKRVLKQKNG